MNKYKIYAFADEADKNLDGQIEALKRNGLQGLEIRGIDDANVVDLSENQAKEIHKKLVDNGLDIYSIGSPIGKINITESFDAHLESFKRLLETSKLLGAQCMRIFSFFIPKDKQAENYRDEVFYRLFKLCELAKPYDITLCHENEKGIYGDTAKRCLDIIKNVPQLKSVFDPANFVQCNEDTIKAWGMLGDSVKYVHIKDALANGLVVKAGAGIGNIEYILNQYNGDVLTLEPHLFEFSGLEKLEREGDKSVVGVEKYSSANEAFDAGANALKSILEGK